MSEPPVRYLATVRYGAMRYTARFHALFQGVKLEDLVIVRTDRGVEVGNVVSIPCKVEDDSEETQGEILRVVTDDDREKIRHLEEEEEPRALKLCQKKIEEHKLPMKLARAEKLFGGNKAIFYFLADGRVDFRELVKDLAKEYQTRIQMMQIGVRDEARLLADYEHCGRQLCCRTFIKKLEPVSMKMAKSQKATLDPSKISGRCGRLMCCLKFEDKMYDELKRNLPKKGSRVRTKEGVGEVVSFDVLQQTVRLEIEDERRFALVHVTDIEENLGREKPSQASPDAAKDSDEPEPSDRKEPRKQGDRGRDKSSPASQDADGRSGESRPPSGKGPRKQDDAGRDRSSPASRDNASDSRESRPSGRGGSRKRDDRGRDRPSSASQRTGKGSRGSESSGRRRPRRPAQ